MRLLFLVLVLLPHIVMAQPRPAQLSANLQRGLVGRWVVMPPQQGGLTWYPQVGNDKGTLVNMTTAGTGGWQPTVRPGGAGEMRFDGADDQVNTGASVLLANLPAFTICLWFRSTSSGTQQLYTENVGGWPDMMLALKYPSTGINFNNYNIDGTGIEVTGTAAAPEDSNTWQHLCAVQLSKTSGQVYSNGKLAGSGGGATVTVAPTQRAFGGTPEGTNRLTGALDDICTWTRALSAQEVGQVYTQSAAMPVQQVVNFVALFTAPPAVVRRGSFLPFFTQP